MPFGVQIDLNFWAQ